MATEDGTPTYYFAGEHFAILGASTRDGEPAIRVQLVRRGKRVNYFETVCERLFWRKAKRSGSED